MSERLTYRFGPLERRGLLGGLRAGQVTSLALGVLLAVIALDAAPSGGGVLVAALALAVALLVAVAPLGGRTLHEWAPIATGFALGKLAGEWRSSLPTTGIRAARRQHAAGGDRRSGARAAG